MREDRQDRSSSQHGQHYASVCSLDLRRKALLPKVLNVIGAEQVLRSAFKSPFPNAPAQSNVRLHPSASCFDHNMIVPVL